uniref:K Homology domain-containing protein n=1 Tax=Panagrolaimus sp. JU765 TaxID=591449 RepID=A0AC34QMA7_9BILA
MRADSDTSSLFNLDITLTSDSSGTGTVEGHSTAISSFSDVKCSGESGRSVNESPSAESVVSQTYRNHGQIYTGNNVSSERNYRRRPRYHRFNFNHHYDYVRNELLAYFQQLGGDPELITNNKVASQQLNELCQLYYLASSGYHKYDHAIHALYQSMMATVNENTSINNPASNSSSFLSVLSYKKPRTNNVLKTYNIKVPENKECNLIGRVLGPRGMTVRELESRFRCRIFVRGRGSIRDTEKAERLKSKPGWEHLDEDLHIHIQVSGSNEDDVDKRMSEVKHFIERLLHPQGFDAFKRRQLISLAFMNGTFRPPTQLKHIQPNHQAGLDFQHFHPSQFHVVEFV